MKKINKNPDLAERPESSVLSPKQIFLGAASAYLTTLACVVSAHLEKYGNNKWFTMLAALADDLDFEARSGDLTEKQLYAVQKAAIHLTFACGEEQEYPHHLFKALDHAIQHMRGAREHVEKGSFEFDMIQCMGESSKLLNEDVAPDVFERFRQGRDEWYKQEVFYRKHPERRPGRGGLGIIILGGFDMDPHPHGKAKKDKNTIEI